MLDLAVFFCQKKEEEHPALESVLAREVNRKLVAHFDYIVADEDWLEIAAEIVVKQDYSVKEELSFYCYCLS